MQEADVTVPWERALVLLHTSETVCGDRKIHYSEGTEGGQTDGGGGGGGGGCTQILEEVMKC